MDSPITGQDWNACPAGVLGELSRHRQKMRRRQFIGKVTTVAMIACLGFVGFGLLASGPVNQPGQLHCHEVKKLMPDYRAEHLAPSLMARVRIHLAECPDCKSKFSNVVFSTEPVASDCVAVARYSILFSD